MTRGGDQENEDVMFTPLTLGSGKYTLDHRVVLAPLTRCRASQPELAPRDMFVDYYAQRASKGGLLITEATHISPESMGGYPNTPGIWTDKQVEEWTKVVDAVHAKGALMSMQLWHIGRVSHHENGNHPLAKDSGLPLPSVSSSDVMLEGTSYVYGKDEEVPNVKPRPLKKEEIPRLLEDYRRAARNAMKAGFDLVEIHGAHSYLIDQFLCDSINKRTDEYGGSIENRCRLLLEVVEAVVDEVGAGRTALRLSPTNPDDPSPTDDSDPDALFSYAIEKLDKYKLAYLLLTEPRWSHLNDNGSDLPFFHPQKFRKLYSSPIFGSGGFNPINSRQALNNDLYDGVAFGRWFIANPDLPERLREGLPLNKYDRSTFYGYTREGYTDYPFAGETSDKYELIEQDKIGTTLAKLQA